MVAEIIRIKKSSQGRRSVMSSREAASRLVSGRKQASSAFCL